MWLESILKFNLNWMLGRISIDIECILSEREVRAWCYVLVIKKKCALQVYKKFQQKCGYAEQ